MQSHWGLFITNLSLGLLTADPQDGLMKQLQLSSGQGFTENESKGGDGGSAWQVSS